MNVPVPFTVSLFVPTSIVPVLLSSGRVPDSTTVITAASLISPLFRCPARRFVDRERPGHR